MAKMVSAISFRRSALLSSEADWTRQRSNCSFRDLIVIPRVVGSKAHSAIVSKEIRIGAFALLAMLFSTPPGTLRFNVRYR